MNLKAQHLVHFLAIALISILNLSFVSKEYAWADDWSFLSGYLDNENEVRTEHLSGYRPGLQLIFNYSFGELANVGQLRFLRIISVLGTLILSIAIFYIFRSFGWGYTQSTLVASTLSLLPSFQIYQKWATAFPYPWVALLSLLSFLLFQSNHRITAFAFLFAAFSIYQPAATFGSCALLAKYLKVRKLSSTDLKYSATICIAFLVSTLFSRIFLFSLGTQPKQRSGIIQRPDELFEKFQWIFTRPLMLAFRPFAWDSPQIGEVSIAILFLTIFLFSIHLSSKSISDGIIQGLVFVGIFLLMLLPLIPIKENQIEFRVLPSTSFGGLVIVVSIIGNISNSRIARVSIQGLSVFLIGYLCFYTDTRTREIFVQPFEISRDSILNQRQKWEDGSITYSISYSNWPSRDFVGSPSAVFDLQMPWVARPMLSLLTGISISRIHLEEIGKSKNEAVLDLDEIKILPIRNMS